MQSTEDRAASIKKLGDIAALQPAVVVPGPAGPGQPNDVSQVAYTQAYLQRFEPSCQASNSAALIEAMKAADPSAGLGIALEIGAKVNKGEMKW